MKNYFYVIALIFTSNSYAEINCEKYFPLPEVNKICSHPFKLFKAKNSEKRCKAEFIDEKMKSKNVAEVGISDQINLKINFKPKNKKGRNMAKISHESVLSGAKTRGIFKKEIPELGSAAYYSEQKIQKIVSWYKGEYVYQLIVEAGKKEGHEWVSPCTSEQVIKLAKLIVLK